MMEIGKEDNMDNNDPLSFENVVKVRDERLNEYEEAKAAHETKVKINNELVSDAFELITKNITTITESLDDVRKEITFLHKERKHHNTRLNTHSEELTALATGVTGHTHVITISDNKQLKES